MAPPLMKYKFLSSLNEINCIFNYKHLNSNDVKYLLDFFVLEKKLIYMGYSADFRQPQCSYKKVNLKTNRTNLSVCEIF